jgi:hypothetical integral membrane protein (TIGR02206 family)
MEHKYVNKTVLFMEWGNIMGQFFSEELYRGFIVFSKEHLWALFFISILMFFMFVFRKELRNRYINLIFRYVLFSLLLFSELSLHYWLIKIGSWSIYYSLPLHLSSISLILSLYLLVTSKKSIFYFVYFAGLGSALQAILTPDLGYGFPHFRFLHFFIGHGGILLTAIFFVFVEKYKATFRSLISTFAVLNGIAFIIFIFNLLIGSNYMYLLRKPINTSLLDYFGPWPYYIIGLEIITFISFMIFYLPFFPQAIKNKF